MFHQVRLYPTYMRTGFLKFTLFACVAREYTLMWERKLELKRQAKSTIERDFNKRELEDLRNEVHKLEVRKFIQNS